MKPKLLFLILSVGLLSSVQAKVLEKVVAVVNSDIVTLTDLVKFKRKLTGNGLIDDALMRVRSKDELLKSRKQRINHLIDERIMDSEVKKQGLTATIEQVEREIRGNTKRLGLKRSQLIQALKKRGVAFSDYQNFIRKTIERRSLIQREISSQIKITEADISAHYATQKNTGPKTYEYTLAHILFLPQKGGDLAALDRATSLVAKLKKGSFNKLASTYSEDPNFSQGGVLGKFKSGEMLPEIENSVKKLKTGQTSKVVKTRMGYHIFKVMNKRVTNGPKLDSQKNRIRAELFDKAFGIQLKNWLARKKNDAFIKIN